MHLQFRLGLTAFVIANGSVIAESQPSAFGPVRHQPKARMRVLVVVVRAAGGGVAPIGLHFRNHPDTGRRRVVAGCCKRVVVPVVADGSRGFLGVSVHQLQNQAGAVSGRAHLQADLLIRGERRRRRR